MSDRTPDLSAIIPSFDTARLLADCLQSIRSHRGHVTVELIVADNASTDGTREMLGTQFPDVTLVPLPTNRGYGAACNAGAARAHGDILLFLNSDTRVLGGALDSVVAAFREFAEAAAVACHELTAAGGTVQGCRAHHTLRSAISFLSGYRLFQREGDRYRIVDWDRQSDRWVNNVSGFAWAIRRDVFREIGGFDEKLFLYCEEEDMALRLQRAGFQIRYRAQARIIHLGARSSRTLGRLARRQHWVESLVYVRKKHGVSRSAWLDRAALYPFLWMWWIGNLLKRPSERPADAAA